MKKPMCVVSMTLHPQAQELLSERFEAVSDEKIEKAEAALAYGIPDEWIGRAVHLKAVGCHSCSDAFRAWAKEQGIRITMADSLWRTVAELTLGLALAAARNIPQADLAVRSGKWQDHETLKRRFSGWDFQKKTFCILGMGQIGKELAGLLSGFSMEVKYYDICRLSKEEEERLGVSCCSFRELLETADYFALLIPHNSETEGMFDEEVFSHLKKGCVFINTARSAIIKREAFVKAMRDGTIGAAALDVAWEEGQPQKEDLLSFDNLIFTPHLGGSTFECDAALVNSL